MKKEILSLKLLSKEIITGEESDKKTCLLTLELLNGSYAPGDTLAVYPQNDPEEVKKIIAFINADPKDTVIDPRTKTGFTLYEYLLKKANISRVNSFFIQWIAAHQTDKTRRAFFQRMANSENKEETSLFLASHSLLDLLKEEKDCKFTVQELASQLLPLSPRLYSIASSLKKHPGKIRLLIVPVEYKINGKIRKGVATHYLCSLSKPGENISAFIQKSRHFHLHENDKDIIMVGPGTGVAPFISFLEEREITSAAGKNWLFFGERKKATDFYMEDYLLFLEKKGFLKLSLAFSRDQEKKIYVQDKILEEGKEIYHRLKNDAVFYICGNTKMAIDVEKALSAVFQIQGNMTLEEVKDFFKQLKKERRFLKDVY